MVFCIYLGFAHDLINIPVALRGGRNKAKCSWCAEHGKDGDTALMCAICETPLHWRCLFPSHSSGYFILNREN